MRLKRMLVLSSLGLFTMSFLGAQIDEITIEFRTVPDQNVARKFEQRVKELDGIENIEFLPQQARARIEPMDQGLVAVEEIPKVARQAGLAPGF